MASFSTDSKQHRSLLPAHPMQRSFQRLVEPQKKQKRKKKLKEKHKSGTETGRNQTTLPRHVIYTATGATLVDKEHVALTWEIFQVACRVSSLNSGVGKTFTLNVGFPLEYLGFFLLSVKGVIVRKTSTATLQGHLLREGDGGKGRQVPIECCHSRGRHEWVGVNA